MTSSDRAAKRISELLLEHLPPKIACDLTNRFATIFSHDDMRNPVTVFSLATNRLDTIGVDYERLKRNV